MSDKINHKAMTQAAEIYSDTFERYLHINNLESRFDPNSEGGFLWCKKTGLPTKYVRSPFWRKEKNDPQIHRNDVRPVYTEPKSTVALQGVETGGELEMYVWDPIEKNDAPVMGSNSSVPQMLETINMGGGSWPEEVQFEDLEYDKRQVGYSAEVGKSCIEMNFHHTLSTYKATLEMARSLKILAHVVEQKDWRLIPIAAFPHRHLNPEDVSQDPYVNRIVMEFMKWENARHFIGSSFQVHVEMIDLESGLKAINMYQQVAPLLYALSLAGPFAYGSTRPNLKNSYSLGESNSRRINDGESYEDLNYDDWMSVRYPGRWRGSPSEGSYITPLPENAQDFFNIAEIGLKINNPDSSENIPSPARAGGHHTDRVRVDIGPNGTLEISNMDTFGGHILKLGAIQEFTKALMWKLQLYAKSGRMEDLFQQFPQLFPSQVTEQTLRFSHINSIEVAKSGIAAVLMTPNRTKEVAGLLFNQLLAFVNEPISDPGQEIEYYGLPQGVIQELVKSSMIPNEHCFEDFREDGVVSVSGFYKSGIGTLSHWLKQRAQDFKGKKEMSDDETIKDCMDDLGKSYHSFLSGLNGNIKALFDK